MKNTGSTQMSFVTFVLCSGGPLSYDAGPETAYTAKRFHYIQFKHGEDTDEPPFGYAVLLYRRHVL